MPARSHLQALRPSTKTERASDLRTRMTDAERRLWYYLRDRRFEGWKFRRQVPLGPYIVDFLCEEARLVIEVDGGQHNEGRSRDAARTAWIERRGYRVVRFWNHEVLGNTEGVLTSLTPTLSQGRGGTSI